MTDTHPPDDGAPERRVAGHVLCSCEDPAVPHCSCSQRDDCLAVPFMARLRAAERERDALAVALADERARNAPLRARIKDRQDHADRLLVRVAALERCLRAAGKRAVWALEAESDQERRSHLGIIRNIADWNLAAEGYDRALRGAAGEGGK